MRPTTMFRRASAGSRQDEGGEIRAAYDAHGSELYRFALRQLGDEGAAQDVVQEVFLRAWRSSASFDPELAGLRVWLFAIARNAVIDEWRRRSARPRGVELSEEISGAQTSGAPFDDRLLDAWVVEEALRRISPEHRSAIVEIHLRNRPVGEVAAEQGVPAGTIRSRVFYGLKSLRLTMDEMGVEP